MYNNQISFFESIDDMPALNWLFFECYYSLDSYMSNESTAEEEKTLSTIKGLAMSSKLDEIEKLCDSRWAAIQRSKTNRVPYCYLALDCLVKSYATQKVIGKRRGEIELKPGKNISNAKVIVEWHEKEYSFKELIQESESFTYDKVSLNFCRNELVDAYKFMQEELKRFLSDTALFSKEIYEDKKSFSKKAKLLSEMDLTPEGLEKYSIEMLTYFLKDSKIPEISTFKEKYWQNVTFSLDNLGFKNMQELKEVTVREYYGRLAQKYETASKQNIKAVNSKMSRGVKR